MFVRVADIKDSDRIAIYLNTSDQSSLYHDYLWGEVIWKSFHQKTYYLICEDKDGSIQGILPLVHLKSLLFGNILVSMPFFNYGGVITKEETPRALLIQEAIRIAKEKNSNHLELRQEMPLNNGFSVKTNKVSMRLGLPKSREELWKSFPSKLRSQIRVPQKAGMSVRIGRLEELDNFFTVFSINMRDLGTPVYPLRFFRNILERFPGNTRICTVYQENMPVASGFLAGWKDKLEIPWASSLRQFNRMSPNMLLYWSCMAVACEQGYAVFDFGRSTVGESTFRFKEQWGALPVPLYWHFWMPRNKPMPELTTKNPKYRIAISLWKKLPVPVTRFLGPRIVKNIP